MNSLIKSQLLKRNAWLVALFTFLTATIYDVYWFYKMFKATGDKFPILKTIFSFIFIFQLFPNIYRAVGWKRSPWPFIYASIYLLATIGAITVGFVTQGSDLYYPLSMVFFLVMSIVIGKVHHVTQTPAKKATESKYSGGELAWLIVGIVYSILALLSFIFFAPQNVINERYAEIDARLQVAEKIQNDLFNKNEVCVAQRNAELESLDNSNQEAVDTYNQAVEVCDKIYEQHQKALSEYLRISFEYFPAMLRSN